MAPIPPEMVLAWLSYVPAECGAAVQIAHDWGLFERGNERIDRLGACAHCAWSVALATSTTQRELVALNPASAAEHDALVRLHPRPFLYLDICRFLLKDIEEHGPDSGRFIQALTIATRHRPVVLLDTLCTEDSCDHDEKPQGCYADADTVACRECTISAGPWAGAYEGYVEVLVLAEDCPMLPAMAKAYGVKSPCAVCGESSRGDTELCNLHTPLQGNIEVRRGGGAS
ncbi:hypothetical protein [Lentzea guizhouensis]|uniref:hypothetical protein n=1 Tax=Lentzea guizhouensis TaxID=1586287 RepID=UPI0012B691E9|nr:hypothetical protein [Lentzea guizhouensis]